MDPAARHARDLDLVVWGATGYTGRLVARAVAARGEGLRLGLGGRDRVGLERLRAGLGVDAELLVADAHDAGALGAMARRTRAVVSTVGPYARLGTPLVAACVAAGTDYADLAAEVPWMRAVVDRFHDAARASGARIVHACGFDSAPSDLGVLVLQREALARHGEPCREVLHLFGPLRGGVSAGTIASSLGLIDDAARDPEARRLLLDPDALAPGATPTPADEPDPWPQRHEPPGAWSAPFPMVVANAKVVRRTRALLGEPWGTGFRYRERLRAATWARAAALSAGQAAGTALVSLAPVRALAERLAPEGPSERVRERGLLRTLLVGRVEGSAEPVLARVAADLDPGYGAATRMAAEVGLGLARGEFGAPGGVLTPAVVGGERLVARLGEVGVRIEALPG